MLDATGARRIIVDLDYQSVLEVLNLAFTVAEGRKRWELLTVDHLQEDAEAARQAFARSMVSRRTTLKWWEPIVFFTSL